MRWAAWWEIHRNSPSTISSVSPVSRVVFQMTWRRGCSDTSNSTVAGGELCGTLVQISRWFSLPLWNSMPLPLGGGVGVTWVLMSGVRANSAYGGWV